MIGIISILSNELQSRTVFIPPQIGVAKFSCGNGSVNSGTKAIFIKLAIIVTRKATTDSCWLAFSRMNHLISSKRTHGRVSSTVNHAPCMNGAETFTHAKPKFNYSRNDLDFCYHRVIENIHTRSKHFLIAERTVNHRIQTDLIFRMIFHADLR